MKKREINDVIEFKDICGDWSIGTLKSGLTTSEYSPIRGYYLTDPRGAKCFIYARFVRDVRPETDLREKARAYVKALGFSQPHVEVKNGVVFAFIDARGAEKKLVAAFGAAREHSTAPNGIEYATFKVPSKGEIILVKNHRHSSASLRLVNN